MNVVTRKNLQNINCMNKSIKNQILRGSTSCIYNFSDKIRNRETSASLMIKNKYSILYSISSIGFLTIGYPQLSFIAGAVAIFHYIKNNERFRVMYHNTLDENFIKTRNNKVLISLE